MARPIAETPILTGRDARRFQEEMRRVESLTIEQRKENRRRFEAAVAEAEKRITICI
ncbi:MAG: hypothetical protein ACI4AM_03610 [Muribaculaceae bacterium]